MAAAKVITPVLTVGEIMVFIVHRITPEMKLREVAELMIKYQISGAPVVDNMDKLISILGEGDTLRLAASEGVECKVAHCLEKLPEAKHLITLQKHDSFTDAYRIFLKYKIHRIPIVDGNGTLKGLVTRSTILRMMVEAHFGKKINRQGN